MLTYYDHYDAFAESSDDGMSVYLGDRFIGELAFTGGAVVFSFHDAEIRENRAAVKRIAGLIGDKFFMDRARYSGESIPAVCTMIPASDFRSIDFWAVTIVSCVISEISSDEIDLAPRRQKCLGLRSHKFVNRSRSNNQGPDGAARRRDLKLSAKRVRRLSKSAIRNGRTVPAVYIY
jgi:hypothetical protein